MPPSAGSATVMSSAAIVAGAPGSASERRKPRSTNAASASSAKPTTVVTVKDPSAMSIQYYVRGARRASFATSDARLRPWHRQCGIVALGQNCLSPRLASKGGSYGYCPVGRLRARAGRDDPRDWSHAVARELQGLVVLGSEGWGDLVFHRDGGWPSRAGRRGRVAAHAHAGRAVRVVRSIDVRRDLRVRGHYGAVAHGDDP